MGIYKVDDWLSVSLRDDMGSAEYSAKTLLIQMLFANYPPKEERYSYGSFLEKDVTTILSLCFISDMELTAIKYKSINSKESFVEKIVNTSIDIGREIAEHSGIERFKTLSLTVVEFRNRVNYILSYRPVSYVMGSSVLIKEIKNPNVEYEFFFD